MKNFFFFKSHKQVLDFAFKTFFELFFRKFEEKMSKVSTIFQPKIYRIDIYTNNKSYNIDFN